MAIVTVQGTVACWLIGVEITLYQKSGNAMLKHIQITDICYTGIGIHSGRISIIIKVNITTHVINTGTIVSHRVNRVGVENGPTG